MLEFISGLLIGAIIMFLIMRQLALWEEEQRLEGGIWEK